VPDAERGAVLSYVETSFGVGAAVFTGKEVDMTVSRETEAEILRLYHAEKWPVNTIAAQLHVHHSVVKRVLMQDGVTAGKLRIKPSKADPYLGFIEETLKKYPKLTASRLHAMVKARGYTGAGSRFRDIVARYRPRPAEAYLRIRTLPGEQAQVDWGYFGKVKFGNAERRLLAFVVVLSWSRQIFLRFYPGDAMPYFLRGHVDAFQFFGAVPREILYDNLKSAVLERVQDAIRFNPTLLGLAGHYRFLPKPVNVARGNEKGRVEKAIRYVRDSFFVAREWKDLDDLNEQALQWCLGVSAQRKCAEDRTMTVAEAFALEKENLLALPDNPFPAYELAEARVGKTPYVRFDLNDYSVPHTLVKKTLSVVADMKTVRILDGRQEVACHQRIWERGRQIENPDHIKELEEHKKEAKQHRGMDRLRHAAPSSKEMLRMCAERGGGLGGLTSGLLKLLDLYGAAELEQAIREAVESQSVHLSAVRLVLERRRREKDLAPPVEIAVPDDPRIRNLVVIPHSLSTYDELHAKKEKEEHD
jgi:transposase